MSVISKQRAFARSKRMLSNMNHTITLYDKGYDDNIPIKTNSDDQTESEYMCFFEKIQDEEQGDYSLSFSFYKKETPESPIFNGVLLTNILKFNSNVVKDTQSKAHLDEISVAYTNQTVTLTNANGHIFYFSSYFDPFANYYIQDVTYYAVQSPAHNIQPDSVNKILKILKMSDNLEVGMSYIKDNWGLNLTEMICTVNADKKYPNGYDKKLIGYCDKISQPELPIIQTLYSHNPNLSKVLKCKGKNLLDQTNKINKKYNNIHFDKIDKNCEFFEYILAYCTLRYMFGGLSNDGNFSCKWLYSNHYDEFLLNLKNSDFSESTNFFTDPIYGITDYNKYFRSCK